MLILSIELFDISLHTQIMNNANLLSSPSGNSDTAFESDDNEQKNDPNEESIMASASIDGTPFSVLMSQAIKLKSAQEAPSRTTYDHYPTFYKHSIYPHDEVVRLRRKDTTFQERLDGALAFKEEGNLVFREGLYLDAITKYEMALAVFKYIENVNPNWKSEVRFVLLLGWIVVCRLHTTHCIDCFISLNIKHLLLHVLTGHKLNGCSTYFTIYTSTP